MDGVRTKVCSILVNLLPFPLLSSRKSVGTGSANNYCLLIIAINGISYLTYCVSSN